MSTSLQFHKEDYLRRETHRFYVDKVGEYSFDEGRNMSMGRRSIRYLHSIPVEELRGLDLNAGFDTFTDMKEYESKDIDVILHWLRMRFPKGGKLRKLINSDFVSYRGTLARIAETPYAFGKEWQFRAIRRKDVIFLCEIRDYGSTTLANYRGFKFEQVMTASSNELLPDLDAPINHNEQFAAVLRSELYDPNGKRLSLYYAAEIDAVDKNNNMLEMKLIHGDRYMMGKAKTWWMQSHLAQVKRIYVGIRDRMGYLEDVKSISTDLLGKQSGLSPNVCHAMLYKVLSNVKSLLTQDGDTCTVTKRRGRDVEFNVSGRQIDFLNYDLLRNFH